MIPTAYRCRAALRIAVAALSLTFTPAVAQEWDVSIPRGETRDIDFTTSEGTWMSVDLSPDQSWIVFDLLGHIYRMPVSGGSAEVLTQESGIALNYHPRISPDGATIAFISDRGGMDNLWVMNADGSNPRAVFLDQDSRAVTPVWSPDGRIVVRREPIARSGAGENGLGIWIHPLEGGEGEQLSDAPEAHWPSISSDGEYLFYHTVTGGRNRDASNGDFQLQRLDLSTGVVIDVTSGSGHGSGSGRRSSGGAFAPEISPDGRWLAFGRHIPDGTVTFKGQTFSPRTGLWLLDLETGEEHLALDPISIAVESHDKNLRVLPGYDWSSDGSSILISGAGEIVLLDVASGEVTPIPFEAHVQRTISQQVRAPFRIEDGPLDVRFMRWQTSSPDGETLAFQAVGRIWVTDTSGGEARRITPEDFAPAQEFGPAWSPDGAWIAFTTLDDGVGGHLWKVPAAGGEPVLLASEVGEYVHPAWSPEGDVLVVAKGSGATFRERTVTHNPWWDLVLVPAEGGEGSFVTRVALPAGSQPQAVQRRAILAPSWGPEGRIFFPDFVEDGTALTSVMRDGSDRRAHLLLPSADEAVASPDGRWVAFQEENDVYLVPFPMDGGDLVEMDRHGADSLSIQRLSTTGGLFVRWLDSTSVEFGSGDRYFRYDVASAEMDTISLDLEVAREAVASGSIALTGARLVTFEGAAQDEVIEGGTIVVSDGRISCVGECSLDGVEEVIDASGKTIIPGLVDMHAHHHREHRGYRPLHDYEVGIYLAYGVTTNLDNSMWNQNIFPTAELIETGRMLGPRTFSTGDPLPFEELTSPEVTVDHVARLRSWGAVSLKQHSHPRRNRRQWIAEAARTNGEVMLTAEGYDLEYNLGHAMDGYSGWEHPLSIIPLYSDVATFFGQAGIVYSNPFMFNSATTYNIEYWYAESDVWQDEKQRRWMPWRMNTFLRRRELRPDTEYSFPMISQGLADLIDAGGHVALGGHGEHHGLSIHWELWMAATALGPMGALRTSSMGGAYFLGVQEDIGSLVPGKLGDLLVLNSNPLEDIQNSIDIQYVMKGGILFEADTLDQVWPNAVPFGPYYWVDEDAMQMNDRPVGDWFSPGVDTE